ncbi:hypothetical protein RI845_15620 [Thalassotalea nanhaiensis]|uniref:Uncharacterized protein n=1 Tax=Thalassotalea nanhaiensis TaxID=3065648 RepID=A0ABY9THN8_9GAMM|nr:hypothetical protein RI845_15620 [Colwelliaceae bacterium SQ345]
MRIFNKQRKFFVVAKKVRQYSAYALGEIVLITVGILLALQLNSWDKARKDSEKEAILINKLKIEFIDNQKYLDDSIVNVGTVVSKMTHFLTLMGPEPSMVDDNLVHDYVAAYYWNPSYAPSRSVFDASLSSGDINLIKNRVLQEKLHEWSELLSSKEHLEASIGTHQHNYANAWLGMHSWKSAIALTGEMEGIGPSNFPFDQKKFLSLPALEHAVSLKLILVNIQKNLLIDTSTLQKEIIDLLHKEISSLQQDET